MAIETKTIISVDTKQAESNIGSLKARLREVREQMQRLAEQGDRTSEAYQKLAQEAGELAKAQREVAKDVSEASTTFTNTVSYTAGALSGVSGAVSAVTGALSAMGIEANNNSKAMKAMVAAMSITSGLQAIQNGVESFKLLYNNIKRATQAQTALNVVMKASPYALAAAAIAGIVAVIGKAVNETKNWREEQKKLREEENKVVASYQTEIMMLGKLINVAGDTTLSYRERNNAINELNKKYPELNAHLNTEGNQLVINKKALEEYKNQIIAVAKAKAAQGKIEELYLQQLELEDELAKANKENEYNKLHKNDVAITGNLEDMATAQNTFNKLADDSQKKVDDLNQKINDTKAKINSLSDIAVQASITGANAVITNTNKAKEEVDDSVDEIANLMWRGLLTPPEDIDFNLDEFLKQVIESGSSFDAVIDDVRDKARKFFTDEDGIVDWEGLEKWLSGLHTVTEAYEELSKKIKESNDEATDSTTTATKIMAFANNEWTQAVVRTAQEISGALSSIANAMGEENEEVKNLKIAATIIDTLVGSFQAFTSCMDLPFPMNFIAGAAAVAGVVAQGVATINKIKQVDAKNGSSGSVSMSANPSAIQTVSNQQSNVRLTNNDGSTYDMNDITNQMGDIKVILSTKEVIEETDKMKRVNMRNTF